MKKEIRLELIKEGDFLNTKCSLYKDENDNIYMTREQIGQALNYSDPIRNISKLHERNKDRLDQLSTVVVLTTIEGNREVARDTTLYIEKGIYDICRFSRQPVADQFYDWVYDQIQLLRQTSGVINLGEEKEFLDNYFPMLSEDIKLAMVKDLNENIKKQQEKIKELTPQAENWSAYMDAKGNITISNLAKSLNIKGIGRNKLFEILRSKEVLRNNNEPYQRYVDSEYFEVVNGVKNGFKFNQTVVTGKGMGWINKKMKEWGYA